MNSHHHMTPLWVIRVTRQVTKNKYFMIILQLEHNLGLRHILMQHVLIFLAAAIVETMTTQPAVAKQYPILPSAPPAPGIPQNQNYGSISEVMQAQPAVNNIIIVGACPICRIGLLEDDYSCLGICLAIFLFPLGILCCLACKNKRCSNCGAVI